MNEMRAQVYEDEPLRPLRSVEELNELLLEAAEEAKAAGRWEI